MDKKIEVQKWMKLDETSKVMSALGEARFVGGCVRDAIIGKHVNDIDICTPHKPDEVTKLLEEQGIKTIPTGIEHGTVTAVIGKHKYEITTLRKDVDCFGRHAEVEFTDNWEEDAARRDFTFNALSMDMEGNIHDYFGGLKDLEDKVVKFVGDAKTRIEEDYLRVLRLFRFHSHYGEGDILPENLDAVKAEIGGLESLSGERIQVEMMKILKAKNPAYVLKTMNDLKVIEAVSGGISFDIKKVEGLTKPIDRLAAAISSKDIEKISDRWKLSNKDTQNLENIHKCLDEISAGDTEAKQKSILRKYGKDIFVSSASIASLKEHLDLASSWEIPELPVRGKDVVALGVEEGKKIGELLSKAEELWESKDYKPLKKELIDYIKELA